MLFMLDVIHIVVHTHILIALFALNVWLCLCMLQYLHEQGSSRDVEVPRPRRDNCSRRDIHPKVPRPTQLVTQVKTRRLSKILETETIEGTCKDETRRSSQTHETETCQDTGRDKALLLKVTIPRRMSAWLSVSGTFQTSYFGRAQSASDCCHLFICYECN